jgi:potassium/hydrogen antiporter
MHEIVDFGTLVLLVAAASLAAIGSTNLSARLRVPAPAVLLLAAAVASDLWPSLQRSISVTLVERVAVVGLVVILFNGGLEVGFRRFRGSARPILALGLVGTFITAAVVALVARYALDFTWIVSGLVAAAVSPTDPAVMFSVLGGREIAGRSGTTLKGEAGVNDPAGIALMVGMIELARHPDQSLVLVVREFAVEMTIGLAAGALGALAIVSILRRVRLAEGFYAVLALTLAAGLYGATSVLHGSGFLAVFVAGLWLGGQRTPYKPEIERFHASLASLAELTVFVGLGLTVTLSSISLRTVGEGILLMLALAVVARPLATALTLAGSRLTWRDRGFITWSGLKGAAPILLAAFAVLDQVKGAEHVYQLVFVVVLCSVIGQGSLVGPVAGWLRIPMHDRPRLPWELSVRLEHELHGAAELVVEDASYADGRSIRDLPLGADTWISLVVRDGHGLHPSGSLELHAGDRVVLLADPGDSQTVAKLFRSEPAAGRARDTTT